MGRRQRILYYWAPAALWAAVILYASGEQLGASNTGDWLQQFVTTLTGSPLQPTSFELVHFVIRKLAHITEYGIFGALAFRAFRGGQSGWSRSWTFAAIATAAVLAGIDEYHQTFEPGRTGAFSDVVIDICGATLSQLMLHRSR